MTAITYVLFACIAALIAHFACQFGASAKPAFVKTICWLIAIFAFVASIALAIGSMEIQTSNTTGATDFVVALMLYVIIIGVLWHGLSRKN